MWWRVQVKKECCFCTHWKAQQLTIISVCHSWLCISPQYFCQFVRALFKMCRYLYFLILGFFFLSVCFMHAKPEASKHVLVYCLSIWAIFMYTYVYNILIDRIQKPLIKKQGIATKISWGLRGTGGRRGELLVLILLVWQLSLVSVHSWRLHLAQAVNWVTWKGNFLPRTLTKSCCIL